MGRSVRCPSCNRFGSVDSDGFCKNCYVAPSAKNDNLSLVKLYSKSNKRLVDGALAEVGADRVADLEGENINIVLNFIKRRLPVNRTGNIVKETSQFEQYGYEFKRESDGYTLEKGECSYEKGVG